MSAEPFHQTSPRSAAKGWFLMAGAAFCVILAITGLGGAIVIVLAAPLALFLCLLGAKALDESDERHLPHNGPNCHHH